ncbi:hypothetical protein Zm00014a_012409 [Zea mays]|uniref:Uncharacterized protein n=1 Tax=Zea mays TaxID=4577 RepID=A0A317YBK4_MAIZE|nr:hypothetical protein Zm00014a_012409 [Zea mays]
MRSSSSLNSSPAAPDSSSSSIAFSTTSWSF